MPGAAIVGNLPERLAATPLAPAAPTALITRTAASGWLLDARLLRPEDGFRPILRVRALAGSAIGWSIRPADGFNGYSGRIPATGVPFRPALAALLAGGSFPRRTTAFTGLAHAFVSAAARPKTGIRQGGRGAQAAFIGCVARKVTSHRRLTKPKVGWARPAPGAGNGVASRRARYYRKPRRMLIRPKRSPYQARIAAEISLSGSRQWGIVQR
jgi:hypothetical protein